MYNRFQKKSRITLTKLWSFLSGILVFVAILGFFFSTDTLEESTQKQQTEHLIKVIKQDIVQCYALEGTYPPNLQYLEEHYGLTYDKKRFYIDYLSIGSNIFPDVTVIVLEENS